MHEQGHKQTIGTIRNVTQHHSETYDLEHEFDVTLWFSSQEIQLVAKCIPTTVLKPCWG